MIMRTFVEGLNGLAGATVYPFVTYGSAVVLFRLLYLLMGPGIWVACSGHCRNPENKPSESLRQCD
jgi:hypothetical protein